MKASLRKSGIDIIGDVSWGTHFCQFYQTKEDLVDIHAPYFKAGLENGEFCLWVVSQPLEVEEAKEALKQVVPDIDVYLDRGQIEIIPYTHGDVNEGIFDSNKIINGWVKKLDQVLAGGYEGLRTAGNTSWLKKGDWGDFVSYETKVDASIVKRQIISLCSYPLNVCGAADIIDIACSHQFSLIKREGKWERIENFGQKNIPENKLAERAQHQNEQRIGMKLGSISFSAQEMDKLELADIVDTQAIQSLMDDFYKLANIPIGIIDLKGNILVGVGWQDICTRFHRVHPETCRHCVESDTVLSTGVPLGEFKMYKCKNNMWDIVTPVVVGGQHFGNIFLGQFFFEDEPVDFELFRFQARKYGFNEEEYIAALEKAPRLRSEAANTIMAFFMKLASILSYLGYSNLKLAQSLTERDSLVDALQESEEKYRNLIETASEGIWILDAEARTTYVNEKMAEMLGYSQQEMIGKFAWDFADEEGKAILKLNMEKRRQGINQIYEFKLICKDGYTLWVLITAKSIFNKEGKFTGSLGMFTDITEHKQEEHRIYRYNRILEGINKIFSNVVQAKTEEELGNACLSVALEITGSQFGFINEMGTDGLLHDVAKSELGWEQCLMYDKTGHRSLSSNFAVHGLYGSVIKYEKSFFTNDPPSHPESIGLPDGHPPLTSFLGVPLVQNGKTVGLIAVANSENGYSFEQQEDLEAIAPAVMQALHRKRSEESLRLSNLYNRSLIEASLDPLVTIGRDGKITDVNGATEQVSGYSRMDLIGTDFSNYFTEPEKAHTGYQHVFTDGKVWDYSLEIQHKDGRITPVLYNASVYRDEDGEVIGVFAAARDITERKKAEEAVKRTYENLENLIKERTAELEKAYESLKESEEGLAEAQRMAHIGNWDWDVANDKVYWSNELYRIFGLSLQKSAPSYNGLLNYVHPDDRDYVDKSINKGLKEESKNGIDYRIVLDNGEERTVYSKAEVIFDEQNIPVRVKGIVQDITERKKTEEKIQILANVVESSNDAIVTESLDGTITSWNKAAEQIYGYSAEEILGKNISILEPYLVKGEIKYFSEKIKQGKKVQHYETLRLKKDGTVIDISVTLSPILNTSGELVALSAIVRDITERKKAEKALKESEARLRRFYESGMFGVVYYSMNGSIIDANDKFLELVDYTREDLQAGQINWNKMTPPEYHLLDEKCIAELKATGAYAPYEKEYIRKDGLRVPIILGAATFDQLRSEGIAFVLDNTERKKTEIALAQMDRIRIKEIHHRIKNNLQVISSLLDLQAEKFDDEKVREAFREGQNRVVSMSLIHEELYKGKDNDTFDFSAYLRKLAENLFWTYSLSSKNIRLLMELEEDAFFDMDTAVPLGIIVNELVSNSLKHAFNEGEQGEVRIRLCREKEENVMDESTFSLTVSDNGKGIPGEIELESLESLGLQLVSILVEQLDGEIEINRVHGTEFRIIFKAAEKA